MRVTDGTVQSSELVDSSPPRAPKTGPRQGSRDRRLHPPRPGHPTPHSPCCTCLYVTEIGISPCSSPFVSLVGVITPGLRAPAADANPASASLDASGPLQSWHRRWLLMFWRSRPTPSRVLPRGHEKVCFVCMCLCVCVCVVCATAAHDGGPPSRVPLTVAPATLVDMPSPRPGGGSPPPGACPCDAVFGCRD